ncbi:MAG: hypothetical protein MUF16_18550 [Burkholderiaceae bacterium]|nr:hypothetical protein [Burkholderiaceae bacterium]
MRAALPRARSLDSPAFVADVCLPMHSQDDPDLKIPTRLDGLLHAR